MPSGLPLKREVSFLLIQADAASRRGLIQALGLMSAISAIERVKRPLIVVEILAIVLFAAELLYLRNLGTYHPSPGAGLAFLLPPLAITLCFFPLCYLAWFRGQDAPAVRLL